METGDYLRSDELMSKCGTTLSALTHGSRLG
jgi:hypothetical protein